MVLKCLSMEQSSTSFLYRAMSHMVTFERNSERWFSLLVLTPSCNPPRGITKPSSSSNSAAIWDTFCLPPPQSYSHLLQLFNTVCNSMAHPPSTLQPIQWNFLFLADVGVRGRQSICGCQITILLPAILGMSLKILLLVFSLNRHSSFCVQIWWSNSNIAATKAAATLVTSGKLTYSALKWNAGCSQTRCCTADPGYDRPTLRYTCFILASVLPIYMNPWSSSLQTKSVQKKEKFQITFKTLYFWPTGIRCTLNAQGKQQPGVGIENEEPKHLWMTEQ